MKRVIELKKANHEINDSFEIFVEKTDTKDYFCFGTARRPGTTGRSEYIFLTRDNAVTILPFLQKFIEGEYNDDRDQ